MADYIDKQLRQRAAEDRPTTLTPTPKIAAAGWAGAAAILIVWVLGLFGVEMPDVVAAAVAALLAAGAGYLKSQPS